ncbi:alpha-N-acetylgalactosaminidase isoform X2 [Agrilus planipennis]|uniref:Alpha-galactosidase n=1 Tax=Agrilus planipennis TaxID=224129 RepID=A0A7F5R449_AGRPL|nr:alpha-N-acetylgalactosaminidase isoform X2 [Agrilus planipennis]
MLSISVLITICLKFWTVECLNNGLALTPPMGWMTWERFRCITDCELYPNDCISEKLIKRQADLMVSEGYLKAGYEYIVVDDCWMDKERDSDGRLKPAPKRFPNGIKALADYVHSKGLKFGIYENFGTYTCAGYPGMFEHVEIDVETFASWEVDYIKVDACYSYKTLSAMEEGYIHLGQLLNKTGRPIVYSCSWPAYFEPFGIQANYSVLAKACNLWRNWDDIDDSWGNVTNILKWFSKNQDRLNPYHGPGHWNDPDMLLLGNFGLSYDQSKAQMAIWAIMAAPLLMSTDLSTVEPRIKNILQNKEVIAINQDSLGMPGVLKMTVKKIDVWMKPILPIVEGSHTIAVGFLSNRIDGYPYKVDVRLSDLGLHHPRGYVLSPMCGRQCEVLNRVKGRMFLS